MYLRCRAEEIGWGSIILALWTLLLSLSMLASCKVSHTLQLAPGGDSVLVAWAYTYLT